MPPGSKKVWAVWPPSEYNNNIFYPDWAERQKSRNSSIQHVPIGPLLKDCMIALTREDESLYLTAGWIHAVLTLTGPGLIGQSYVLVSSLRTSIECIQYELRYHYVVKDVSATFNSIMDTFQGVLTKLPEPQDDAIWKVLDAVIDLATTELPWQFESMVRTINKVVLNYCRDNWSHTWPSCPCGA
ncbi:hypothetical protein HOY80DRAFT_1002357 [Tuber brumale]|nr:hypothetical protein HOY80DRAFT_1002357 [Tuber brumale]